MDMDHDLWSIDYGRYLKSEHKIQCTDHILTINFHSIDCFQETHISDEGSFRDRIKFFQNSFRSRFLLTPRHLNPQALNPQASPGDFEKFSTTPSTFPCSQRDGGSFELLQHIFFQK